MTINLDEIFEEDHVITQEDTKKISYLRRNHVGTKWSEIKPEIIELRKIISERSKRCIKRKTDDYIEKKTKEILSIVPDLYNYCTLKIHNIYYKQRVEDGIQPKSFSLHFDSTASLSKLLEKNK